MPPNMMNRNPSDSMNNATSDDQDDLKMKLLGLTQLLQGIESIAGDELKPYIDQMIQSAHMKHEQMETPAEEAEEQKTGHELNEPGEDEDEDMGSKPGIEIGIGVGKPKPGEEDEESPEDENKPKGLLAILATRAKKPGK